MEIQACDQEEAKNQPNSVHQTEKREVIRPRPLQVFEFLKKNKLHIRSLRKMDCEAALGSKGFEEERRASKTDDDLVLSERRNKLLHLSPRNAVDLTKQKVSLLNKREESADKPNDKTMQTQ